MRLLLAAAVALAVTPSQLHTPIRLPSTAADYLVVVGSEVLIGFALGLGIAILFTGVQLAGQLISQLGGLSMAEVLSPVQTPTYRWSRRSCTGSPWRCSCRSAAIAPRWKDCSARLTRCRRPKAASPARSTMESSCWSAKVLPWAFAPRPP